MTRSALLDIWDEAEQKGFALNDFHGLDYESDIILAESFGTTPLLFSAPHATKQLRDGTVKDDDQATGGLAEVLARYTKGTYIAMGGGQDGDPNWDKEHPFKSRIKQLKEDRGLRVTFDLHGIGVKTSDKTGAHIGVGLGPNPSAASGFIAQALKARGKRVGIEVRVGNSDFAALRTNGVTATVTRYGLIAVQLELAPHLRFGEDNDENRLAAIRLIAGVALDTIEALEQLDTLAFMARVSGLECGAVTDVAHVVREALENGVPRDYIKSAILDRAGFDLRQVEKIFDERIYRLGEAGELMREWAGALVS